MRQIINIFAVALLLASCQKPNDIDDTIIDPAIGEERFQYTVEDGEPYQRALDNTNLESFAVYGAVTYDASLEEAGAQNPAVEYDPAKHHFNWMYNAYITRSGSASTGYNWSYVPSRGKDEHYVEYWKNNAYHSFFAISPHGVVSGNGGYGGNELHSAKVTPALGESGAFSFNYTIPSTLVALGEDIMVASKVNVGGKAINSDFEPTVKMNFKHALSQVSFSVRLNQEGVKKLSEMDGTALKYPEAKIKVHGLSLTNIATTGVLKFDVAKATVPSSEKYAEAPFGWTIGDEKTSVQWSDTEITRLKSEFIGSSAHTTAEPGEVHLGDNGVIDVVPTALVEGGQKHIALMIPQELRSDAQLVLAYHQNLKSVDGGSLGHEQDVVKEIAINLNSGSAPIIEKFEAGKRYHFDITFDFSEGTPTMHVEASLYDWAEEVVNGDIEGGEFSFDSNSRIYNLSQGQSSVEIPFTTTYLENDFKTLDPLSNTWSWNISCDNGGSATIDYTNSRIVYQAPAGGIAGNHDVIRFTVRGREFDIDIYSGEFSFGEQRKFTIPEGESSIKVYYQTSYDSNSFTPEELARFFNLASKNGGKLTPSFTGGVGYDGSVTYTKPADADAKGIYSDVVTATVAGKQYTVEVFWGYFRLDKVNNPTSLSVTMPADQNKVIIPYYSNFNRHDITAKNANPRKANVMVTTDVITGEPVIQYTALALDIEQDVIEVNVADLTYTITVNMSSFALDEGGALEFVADKHGLAGFKKNVKFKTSFSQGELEAANILLENRDANVSISSFVAGVPNSGELEYLTLSPGGLQVDRVTITIAEREFVYSVITK